MPTPRGAPRGGVATLTGGLRDEPRGGRGGRDEVTSDLLHQQVEYYRARAGEYDEWFYRRGRYDRGDDDNWQWFYEAGLVREALRAVGPVESVLELACGTGIWTRELVRLGRRVTAVDASREVLEINRAKLQSDRVAYVQADLFAWQPEREYDLVYFSFWLSHVPPELLDSFLAKVARATRRGGRVFLIDSRPDRTSTAVDHTPPDRGDTTSVRKLNDGRVFTIVKVFYEEGPLRERLARAGFDARVATTERYFIHASGTRA